MTGTQTPPIIGVTSWLRPLPTFLGEHTVLYTLGKEYADSVILAGGIPIILPHLDEPSRVLDMIDGLLLTGGDDVHPESYGEYPSEAAHGIDLEADRWEIGLVREAALRGLPTLGICRGMQIMAVAFGGRLIQDLEGGDAHPAIDGLGPDDILAQRHSVSLTGGCRLASAYGTRERTVNTIHHQAVVDAGDLAVVGRSEDGVIEAVEPRDGWPAIAVQWHPEKMSDSEETHPFEFLVSKARRFRELRTGAGREVPA